VANRRSSPEAPPDRLQLAATTLLLGIGFLPLLLELRMQIGAFIVAVFALRAVAIRWPRLRPGPWFLGLLTVAGGLNVIDAYRGVAGQSPGIALLVTMMALKMLEVHTRRDLRVLLTLFGFLLVVQFLFDDSAARALLLSMLVIVNLALMFDLTLTSGAGAPAARATRAGRVGLSMTLQALPLALVLFVFFPRLDNPLWDLGIDNQHAVTGLRDWLEPGSVKELVISGEDALRVRFDHKPNVPSDQLYWRGPVLWHTDGRRWMPARHGEFPEVKATVEPDGALLSYTVMLEPTDQHWLIGLDIPIGIPSGARLTSDFQVLSLLPVEDFRVYRMTSALHYRTRGLSLDQEAAALALPDNITERTRDLVAQWTAEDPAPTALVARALRFFNQEPFRYTLLPPALGDNPMDAFLFELRSGFCEHYAASFALLMRIAGIPSRIVLGYLGGEFNPLSGDYLIRQSDAHAWTEVWLGDRGWVRVDPTAAVAAERVDANARLAALGAGAPVRFRLGDRPVLARLLYNAHLIADAMDAGWKRWVVGFSRLKQQRLLQSLGLGQFRELGLALGMIIGGAALMLLLSLALGRPPRVQDPVLRQYQRFLRKLQRLGLGRHAQEGPIDHRDRVVARRPDLRVAVDRIVALYVHLRYGGGENDSARHVLERHVKAFRPRRRPTGAR